MMNLHATTLLASEGGIMRSGKCVAEPCAYSTEPHRMDFSLVRVELCVAENVWLRGIEHKTSALVPSLSPPLLVQL
jgi:hypothetical protein